MVVLFDCYSYFYYCSVINGKVFVYCYVSRILNISRLFENLIISLVCLIDYLLSNFIFIVIIFRLLLSLFSRLSFFSKYLSLFVSGAVFIIIRCN